MDLIKKLVVLILTLEARAVLWRYQPKIVAVTGSVGKTSAKDAIYAALAPHLHVRKSEKSFNSEIGVPLTILGCETGWKNPLIWIGNIFRGLLLLIRGDDYPRWLVVEVGADRPGDIRSIAQWLRPDIAVITGVPEIPVHVEFFDSPLALAREKRALAEYVKQGGKLVLNGDDTRMVELCTDFRGMTVKYGLDESNDLYAADLTTEYEGDQPIGVQFRLQRGGSSLPVRVRGALGKPRVYAALAAIAVGQLAGVDEVSIANSLAEWSPSAGRMRVLRGRNGATIIDDSYNSSPVAVLAALDTLDELQGKRKIAVLGDMLELGRFSTEAHRSVGKRVAKVADRLYTVGFRARTIAEAALEAKMKEKNMRVYELNESARAGQELAEELKPGDVVLVKGSQAARMERAVLALMDEPDRAKELLVRQEDEWKNR